MSLDQQDLHAWADRIHEAHQSSLLLQPISDQVELSLADAYNIQSLLTERRLAAGASRIGWKLGYTSDAMRHQMGVTEPNLGPLLSSMLLISGPVPSTFTQPRVEPEIALRMAADLPPQCSFSEAAEAVGAAHAALEIVDSVWADYRFTLPDNTADGSSAAAVVLGPELAPTDDLGSVEVDFFRNDVKLGTGHGRDAMGHPLTALCWLSGELSRHNRFVLAGDIVLTGGLTSAARLTLGDTLRATFNSNVEVVASLPA